MSCRLIYTCLIRVWVLFIFFGIFRHFGAFLSQKSEVICHVSVVWLMSGIRWYHRVSDRAVRHLTEQPLLTSIIQKRRPMLFGHLIRMDELADARRILTAVPQSDWRRPVGWPHSSWMATLKNDLSLHNLTYEDAIEMVLDKLLWRLLAASGATHWWCMPNNDDDDVWYCVAVWKALYVSGMLTPTGWRALWTMAWSAPGA